MKILREFYRKGLKHNTKDRKIQFDVLGILVMK